MNLAIEVALIALIGILITALVTLRVADRKQWDKRNSSLQPERSAFREGLIAVRDRISSSGSANAVDLAALNKLRARAPVIFDSKMAAYLDEWLKHAAASKTAADVMKDRFSPVELRERWLEKDAEAVAFFSKQEGSDLEGRFKKYLGSP